MFLFLILGVLLGAVTVVFALQNITTITVTFLAWELTGSLSLILLLAVATGALICLLMSIPEVIKSHIEFSALKKINREKVPTVALATGHGELDSTQTQYLDRFLRQNYNLQRLDLSQAENPEKSDFEVLVFLGGEGFKEEDLKTGFERDFYDKQDT